MGVQKRTRREAREGQKRASKTPPLMADLRPFRSPSPSSRFPESRQSASGPDRPNWVVLRRSASEPAFAEIRHSACGLSGRERNGSFWAIRSESGRSASTRQAPPATPNSPSTPSPPSGRHNRLLLPMRPTLTRPTPPSRGSATLWAWTDLLQPIARLRRTPCKRLKLTTLPRTAI
jgi:hypothetical protein